MKRLWFTACITLKALLKDRIFILISILCLVYLFIPVFGSLSMRQVQEVGITMSLSLNSFILLLLGLFGSVATVWRDIERRSIYNMLSYPIGRTEYLLGRLLGCILLLLIISILNGLISYVVIKLCASMYKSRLPIMWINIFCSFSFAFLKYVLLLAIGFLFISFSTSFFTPLFLTISVYIVGNASQGFYEFMLSNSAKHYPLWFKKVAKLFYYVLPNFSVFDFTAYAAYAIKIPTRSITYSGVYFLLYFTLVITVACIIFNRRDIS